MKKALLIFLLALFNIHNGYSQDSGNYFIGASRLIGESKYEDAIATCTHIINTDPNFVLLNQVYGMRGNCKRMLNDCKGALVDQDIAVRISPRNATNYYNRALVNLCLDRKVAAKKDFNTAGDLGLKKAFEMIVKYCQ